MQLLQGRQVHRLRPAAMIRSSASHESHRWKSDRRECAPQRGLELEEPLLPQEGVEVVRRRQPRLDPAAVPALDDHRRPHRAAQLDSLHPGAALAVDRRLRLARPSLRDPDAKSDDRPHACRMWLCAPRRRRGRPVRRSAPLSASQPPPPLAPSAPQSPPHTTGRDTSSAGAHAAGPGPWC